MDKYNQEIIGGTLEQRKSLEARMDTDDAEFQKSLEGEMEKTAEQLKMINVINELLEQEFKRLGIQEAPRHINPERVHFLSQEAWNKDKDFKKHPDGGGVYSKPGVIYINVESCGNKEKLLQIFLHEAIHFVSKQKMVITKNGTAIDYRAGYEMQDPKRRKQEFHLLNETIINITVEDMLTRHKERLQKEFGLSSDSFETFLEHETNVMIARLLGRVTVIRNENSRELFDRFMKGQFTGEMMHVRDIEKFYGKGTLRTIASVGEDTEK